MERTTMARGNGITMEQAKAMGIQECLQCQSMYTGGGTCPKCGGRGGEEGKGASMAAPSRQNPPASTETHPKRAAGKRTKAEAMALDRARRSWPECEVIEQPMKLQLTDGGSYTPDLCVRDRKQKIIIIEVKGGYRGPGWEQGIERYKRAKYEWGHWFELRLWTWDRKQQTWRIE
jgi:hypothetical protein